ncbi:hypothetical protein KKH18_00855 [bacterium]|nr:hypothetical protein [bacterium]
MIDSEVNFAEFLGREEQNLVVSFLNLRIEYELFKRLDDLYQSPLSRMNNILSKDEWIIHLLYRFSHFQLYFSIASFFRCHLTDAMGSARKAIDASFIVYYLMNNPDAVERYIHMERHYGEFANLKKNEIKPKTKEYHLAEPLVVMHENFSKYGSHADPAGVISLRTAIETDATGSISKSKFNYFQHWNSIEFQKVQFLHLLKCYYLILEILRLFLDKKIKTIDPHWEKSYETFMPDLMRIAEPYRSYFEKLDSAEPG